MAKVPGKGWRTVGHCDAIALAGATFEVSASGHARFMRTRHRTVHAFVEGDLIAWNGRPAPTIDAAAPALPAPVATVTEATGEAVRYSPATGPYFARVAGGRIDAAEAATVSSARGVWL